MSKLDAALNPETDPRLYRLLYLDSERVRSIAAMLFGGVPENAVAEWEREHSVAGEVSGGLAAIMSAKASTDVLFVNRGSETLALHHFLLMAVIKKLETLGRLVDVDSGDATPEGKFYRLTGQTLVRDYQAVSHTLGAVSRVGLLSARFRREAKRKESTTVKGRPAKDPELAQIADLERTLANDVPGIQDAIDALFEDVVRLRCKSGQRNYVANLRREHLVERSPSGLDTTSHAGMWTILCDANFSPPPAGELPVATGLEKQIDDLVESVGTVARSVLPQSAEWVYPIAVYREL